MIFCSSLLADHVLNLMPFFAIRLQRAGEGHLLHQPRMLEHHTRQRSFELQQVLADGQTGFGVHGLAADGMFLWKGKCMLFSTSTSMVRGAFERMNYSVALFLRIIARPSSSQDEAVLSYLTSAPVYDDDSLSLASYECQSPDFSPDKEHHKTLKSERPQ